MAEIKRRSTSAGNLYAMSTNRSRMVSKRSGSCQNLSNLLSDLCSLFKLPNLATQYVPSPSPPASPMQAREPQFKQKFRNSFRLNKGYTENGKLPKLPERNEEVPDIPTRDQREMRMKQIDDLARERNPSTENLIHLLREKECEVQTLSEELEYFTDQRNELQDALSEAQLIIDQQQDQLSEFRRRAAQSRTDAEAFKMKNMFLSLGATTRDEQLNALTTACDRLEAEVEALTWQLDQNKRSLNNVQKQRDHLQTQLDQVLQWREAKIADQCTNAINGTSTSTPTSKSPPSVTKSLEDEEEKLREMLHRQEEQIKQLQQKQQQLELEQQTTASPNSEVQNGMSSTRVIHIQSEQDTAELNELRQQINQLREREREWARTESRLLDYQQQMEEEREKHIARIEMLMNAKRSSSVLDGGDTLTDQRPSGFLFIEPTFSSCNTYTQSQMSRLTDTGQMIELRRLSEERSRWRLYACNLVRTIVEHCEEFIRRTRYEEPEFHTIAERRWYDYAIYLLEILVEVAPQRLSSADTELIRRNTSSAAGHRESITSNVPSTYNGPDLLSAVTLRRSHKKKSSTNERVAKLARKSLFRVSHSK
ncbi:unnamed protein product [Echinostoma caproni]|uniref:PH domain-containing protein n=1 Tax=Echinostoma caproni TaxID=27848 RepID=A0A183A9U3_9TREM|nr:unnamed protein product [Echinostoma caproni]